MAATDRRTPPRAFRLAGELTVEVLVPMGSGDHLVLPGKVQEVAGAAVTVTMADGAAALAVAASPRCILVWGDESDERFAMAHSGRRIDDVRSPTTIELVLEDLVDLPDRLADPQP